MLKFQIRTDKRSKEKTVIYVDDTLETVREKVIRVDGEDVAYEYFWYGLKVWAQNVFRKDGITEFERQLNRLGLNFRYTEHVPVVTQDNFRASARAISEMSEERRAELEAKFPELAGKL